MTFALALLLPLSFIDMRTRMIPNALVLPALLAALIVYRHWLPAMAMFGLAAAFYNRSVICGGDVKLFVFLAACLGWWVFAAFGLTMLFIGGWRASGHHGSLPVTPFVLMATICTGGILQAWSLR